MAFYNPANPNNGFGSQPLPPSTGAFGTQANGWRTVPNTGAWGMPAAGGWRGTAPSPVVPKADSDAKAKAGQMAFDTVRNDVTSAAKAAQPQQPYGSESGPGILENWFNQRANGTDPAYEYAMQRGGDAIDTRMAAGGSFNSGARGQQLSDFAANMAAQRMGQLDTLAGGASGEHMGRLGMMFNQGLGLANGQAGAGTAYDTAAAGNMAASAAAQQQYALGKAGVDSKANQGLLNTALNAYSIYKMGSGGSGGSGGYQTVDGGAGNPYPQY